MAATVNKMADQWLEERSQAPLDKMKDWVMEISAPMVEAVQGRIGVVQAGKRLLDEGGEAAELGVLAKKISCDAVNVDKDIIHRILEAIALYRDAASLLQAQTAGLGSLGRLADSYMERATAYQKFLDKLGQTPLQPPMTDVEWDATRFVQLRQVKARLGLRPQVGGAGSGRHSSGFMLCMADEDLFPTGSHVTTAPVGPLQIGALEPTTPIQTSMRAIPDSFEATPTFKDLTSIALPSDHSRCYSTSQMRDLPCSRVRDETSRHRQTDASTGVARESAAKQEPALTARQREMMADLEKEFEPCTGLGQNTDRPQPLGLLGEALCKRASSSQLSSPSCARSDTTRSPRGLSPGGYARKDAERQAISRRALRESRRCAQAPRPPPSATTSTMVEEAAPESSHSRSPHSRCKTAGGMR